jgi:hypothetical protein
LPRHDGHIYAATGQTLHRERGVPSPLTHVGFASRRHPQRETVNPPARSWVPDIGERQEASEFVTISSEAVPVKNPRWLAVNPLVLAEHSLLEQFRNHRDTTARDGRAQTQPCHYGAGVVLNGRRR